MAVVFALTATGQYASLYVQTGDIFEMNDQTFSHDPPTREQLASLQKDDLLKLGVRGGLSLCKSHSIKHMVDTLLGNWSAVCEGNGEQQSLTPPVKKLDLLVEAMGLGITKILDSRDNKYKAIRSFRGSNEDIQRAIQEHSSQNSPTPSVGDLPLPQSSSSLIATPVRPTLPTVRGLTYIQSLDEELSPRDLEFHTPRSPRKFRDEASHQMPPPNPLDYGTDNFFANVIQHWWRSKREVAKNITVDGEPYSITLSSTVKELKQMVRIKKKTVLSDVRLTFGGQALQEDRTLRSCLVTERSNLHLEKKIQIFVRNLEGTTLRFLMFASDSGFDLMNKIEALEGIPQQHQRIIFAGHHVEGHHLLSDHHVKDEDTLHLVMRLSGGARGVIKTQFIKSDASLKKLQDRSKQIIQDALMKEKIDMNPLRDIPEELKPLINGVQERIKDLMDKARSGPVIKENLQKLSDDQLSLLSNLMSKKGGTEEKLSQIAHIVNPDVKLITTAIPLLNTLRMELMESFIKLYSEEFHAEWKTEMVYNNEAFKTAVEDIITYRANIRRFAQIEGAVPPPTIHPPPQDTSSCVVA
jgi:hypothetical protein